MCSFSNIINVILSTQKLSDDDDYLSRRFSFVGLVNNVLCYLRKLDSYVKHKLFSSYCNNFFGCELMNELISSEKINDICIAWRKGSRRVWELPYNTHCFFIPLLGNCLPLLDEICRRFLNFIRSCFVHKSNLIPLVAISAICYFRSNSFLVHNILFCMERYKCSLHDLITANCNYVVKQHCNCSINNDQLLTAIFCQN
jgi:hypothetical protein